jgi:hypothetical protein
MNISTGTMHRLLEEIDIILERHEYQENSSGDKWCDVCIAPDAIPMPYSWQNCEMNELRATRREIAKEKDLLDGPFGIHGGKPFHSLGRGK